MSKIDQKNFKKLGAKNIGYIGNLKFCNEDQTYNKSIEKKAKKLIGNRPVWLAASTHSGEENIVAVSHNLLKKELKLKNLLTVIVPRNIKRSTDIVKEIRSIVPSVKLFNSQFISKNTEIIVDDSIGQLEMWYKNIKTVFLGKSLPPKGGQNPIEPARNGCAIISGRMSNFKEIENEMLINKCILHIKNNLDLFNATKNFIKRDSYAKKFRVNAKNYVKSKSLILDKTFIKIKKYLV